MYEVLRDFENYEISPEYPHEIINVITGKIAKETLDIKSGYIKVRLKHKSYYKHRIIAFQFIPNDDQKRRFVDHINHIRTDNRIENLRWVTPSENPSENNRNRSGYKKPYEFVDELPEESISVNHYNDHVFENLYYFDNEFYLFNGIKFRKLHKKPKKTSGKFTVITKDDEGKTVFISNTIFKMYYNIE